MAKDLNKAMIIGNLTRDPEVKTTPNGQQVASFGVATNRQWKNQQGEKQEAVEFHNVVVWGKLAEICGQYLAKGRRAYFEGRLQTDTWEAQDGSKRSRTQIVADDMILLDSRGQGGGQGGQGGAGASQVPAQPTEAEAPQAGAEAAKDSKAKGGKGKGKKDDQGAEDPALDDIPF
ncbi:MAG: single-stranded DNA-binding protein [Patescibacteria group bacterium]|nr:single-stranded DNA-binding protein [Patescibacteria group bacterium]